MKVPAEDRKLLEDFVGESLDMLNQLIPLVRALIGRPEHEELSAKVTASCFRLFHSIGGTAGFLGLGNLTEPANAIEYLLDRIRSGIIPLKPESIALLAEACQFMDKGLRLVLAENSDERLGPSADKLTDAFIHAAHQGEGQQNRKNSASIRFSEEMREALIWEVDQLLETAEQEFVLWDFVAIDQPRVAELLQLLHRLKRNFSLFELQDLERIAQAMESTMERFLNGEFFQGEYPERVFLRAIDVLSAALAEFARSGTAHIVGLDDQLAALQSLMRQPIGELLVKAGLVGTDTLEQALLQQKQGVRKSKRLGEVLIDMGEVTSDQVDLILQQQRRKQEQAEDAEARQQRVSPEAPQTLHDKREHRQDIRVNGRKLQQLLDLTDKLFREDRRTGGNDPYVAQLYNLAKELLHQPVKELTPRLKRLVHDLALKSHKKVQFIVKGGSEEVSRSILDALADPLLHLLRNGIQHGLELPEERVQKGKQQSGRLALLILKREGELWVSVEDDGRGLDGKKIGQMAAARGLVSPDKANHLSSSEVAELIFQLSSQPAGRDNGSPSRGGGMGSVRKCLRELGGTVDVLSKPGKGTRMTLRIPWR